MNSLIIELSNIQVGLLSTRDQWMLITVILCSLFLLDDIFIDLVAIFQKIKPRKLSDTDLNKISVLPEKRFAILMANWHEEDVLERMVTGNIQKIKYSNYKFILGVYPNDKPTLEAAFRLQKKYKNVQVVVNSLDGPTSKGQLLNELILEAAKDGYDVVVTHDSEDLIHPYALKLMNWRTETYDFVQIPVFSLETPLKKLTAGVYIDEFIEAHTKDLLVREFFNAGIPSAGVGTAIKWTLIEKLFEIQDGKFLNENTLTEDYHLGLTCHQLGFKSHFSCDYYINEDGHFEYIATREYFPQKFRQSVRQKTRWAIGISLQGFELLKWSAKGFFQVYFLWRDRKGLVAAPLFTSALTFTIYFIATYLLYNRWPQLDYVPYNFMFEILMWGNFIFSVFRIIQRIVLVNKVYGAKVASLVPVRWVLSNFINTFSTYNAINEWTRSKFFDRKLTWSKTEHMIPVGFGLENFDIIEDQKSLPDFIEVSEPSLIPNQAVDELRES